MKWADSLIRKHYSWCAMSLKNWSKNSWEFPPNIFLKMGQSRPLFCLFSSFSHYNFNNTNWKSVDGVLGIWTRGRRMVGADETTELWRPPTSLFIGMPYNWSLYHPDPIEGKRVVYCYFIILWSMSMASPFIFNGELWGQIIMLLLLFIIKIASSYVSTFCTFVLYQFVNSFLT